MALISRVPIIDAATSAARALEQLLGHDVILTIGETTLGEPDLVVLPEGDTRSVVLPFTDFVVGEVTLVVAAQLAGAMEAVTPDGELLSASLPVIEAAAATIEATIHIAASPFAAGEIATDTLLTSVVGDFAAVPILENDVRIACVVVRVVDDQTPPASEPVPVPAAAYAVPAPPPMAPLLAPAPPAAPASSGNGISLHEFQPLGDGRASGADPRSLTLLNDVHMEVTAELGRRSMKVRDIMALEPGSVVELDRAAGSPIEVFVNGAIVWHGEVVVVDDEFGIRVSEIVMDDT